MRNHSRLWGFLILMQFVTEYGTIKFSHNRLQLSFFMWQCCHFLLCLHLSIWVHYFPLFVVNISFLWLLTAGRKHDRMLISCQYKLLIVVLWSKYESATAADILFLENMLFLNIFRFWYAEMRKHMHMKTDITTHHW